MATQNKAYISLKEAAEISGYSPDYVGQLIRNGKLPGRQVFQQVVWMTSEEDLREYMDKKKSGVVGQASLWDNYTAKLRREVEAPRLAIHALYLATCLFLFLFLILFYIFSSSLDHWLDKKAIERIEARQSL
jgi:hypothetical protein